MNFKDKLQVVGLTAVITAALTLLGWKLMQKDVHSTGTGDDVVIVMNGGSFSIQELGKGSNPLQTGPLQKDLVQQYARRVRSISWWQTSTSTENRLPDLFGQKGTIVLDYCPSPTNAGCTDPQEKDTIELDFDNKNKLTQVKISNNRKDHGTTDPKKDVSLWPTKFAGFDYSHPDSSWHLGSVSFKDIKNYSQTCLGPECLVHVVTCQVDGSDPSPICRK